MCACDDGYQLFTRLLRQDVRVIGVAEGVIPVAVVGENGMGEGYVFGELGLAGVSVGVVGIVGGGGAGVDLRLRPRYQGLRVERAGVGGDRGSPLSFRVVIFPIVSRGVEVESCFATARVGKTSAVVVGVRGRGCSNPTCIT